MPTATRRAPKPRRAPDAGARVVRFGERYVRHFKGEYAGQPFILEPWQRNDIIAPIFNTVDRYGYRTIREALIGIARGNGKSPIALLISLYMLYADGEYGAENYALAADKDQARIVFNYGKAVVEASPILRAASKIYKDAIEVPETGSVFKVRSSLAGLAHGYMPHCVSVDEYHIHKTADLYEAMQSALHKRRQPLIVTITTAGHDRNSPLWHLYQRGLEGNDPSFFMKWYQAPDGCSLKDTKAMREANPGRWVRIAALRRQSKAMPEGAYRRLHLNQWTDQHESWLPIEEWIACGDALPVPLDAPVYVAVDAAPKKDSTAVIVVWRTEDGHHHWYRRAFRADRVMGYLDYLEVEDYIRQLCLTYSVRRIAFDPFTMMRSMITLHEEGLPVEEYPQNDARMVPASQTLWDLVQERRLHHDGSAELEREARNVAAKETARGWRIHKLQSGGTIDSIVAGAIGSHLAEQDAQHGRGLYVYSLGSEDEYDDDELDDDEDDL